MVTYTLIPYKDAYAAGKIQDEILSILAKGIESIDDVDFEKAEKLIDEKFIPFLKKREISIDRYREGVFEA